MIVLTGPDTTEPLLMCSTSVTDLSSAPAWGAELKIRYVHKHQPANLSLPNTALKGMQGYVTLELQCILEGTQIIQLIF